MVKSHLPYSIDKRGPNTLTDVSVLFKSPSLSSARRGLESFIGSLDIGRITVDGAIASWVRGQEIYSIRADGQTEGSTPSSSR